MAIYHCSMKPISRSSGRSAIAAIAYRTATVMVNERDGLVHDFSHKNGIEHSEIVLPDDIDASWAQDRSRLWNTAERSEIRKDARVAREFEIALPHEMTQDQQIGLTRSFAFDLANRYRAAVDFAVHKPGDKRDIRNVHAHVVMTTRTVNEHGLGEKTMFERENKWLLEHGLPTSHMQLRDIRQSWEHHANRHLSRLGLDVRIDHRSHQEQGLQIEPTEHVGVFASQMGRRGLVVSRARIDDKAARRNANLIREEPEQVLSLITSQKSVFDRDDVARTLHRCIGDTQTFQNALAVVMASPALIGLRPESNQGGARYSTREMVAIERSIVANATSMSNCHYHGVHQQHVDRAIRQQDIAVRTRTMASSATEVGPDDAAFREAQKANSEPGLSKEPIAAIHHITGSQQIAAVIASAGAGKSTMLAAARRAWSAQGYRVHGAALVGKVAKSLEESSGIASRTLASWEDNWQAGRDKLGKGDILVIDEAGMLASRQLAGFVAEVAACGAKLVLIGDHEQPRAIRAGSPFHAVTEQVGAVQLTELHRQRASWQRDASAAFATHRTEEGLAAYADQGAIHFEGKRDEALAALVRDYLVDRKTHPSASRIALAHRRADVKMINAAIRQSLQQGGQLASGDEEHPGLGSERIYQTNDGERRIARGDRIVFLENKREFGVKNGMFGTVTGLTPNRLQIHIDETEWRSAHIISIPVNRYHAFDHAYATTIHKSQGTTFDRVFVMASNTMDRHLAYVSMTRHHESVQLYAGRDELTDMQALSTSMSRSRTKDTPLDYCYVFAQRRGLENNVDTRVEITLNIASDRRQTNATDQHIGHARDSQVAQHTTLDERAHIVEDPPFCDSVERPPEGPSVQEQSSIRTVEPLIPAIITWPQSIEDTAREKARADLERVMEGAYCVCRKIYVNPSSAMAKLTTAIIDQKFDHQLLVRTVAEQPEQFGELKGKAGIMRENKERRAARRSAIGFSNHIAYASDTWTLCLEEERRSEIWNREKQDSVEVPGLTPQSEAILRQFDMLAAIERQSFIVQLSSTAMGRQAIDEAKNIARALERRLGRHDLSKLSNETLCMGPDHTLPNGFITLNRIKDIARLVDQVQRAEQSHRYELQRANDMEQDLRL